MDSRTTPEPMPSHEPFIGFDDPVQQSDYVPYDNTGMDNKLVGLDDKIKDKFSLTYDQQLANFDDKDYIYVCKCGNHIETLKTINAQLGHKNDEKSPLNNLIKQYESKIAYRSSFSKSKNMELLKTIRSNYIYKKGNQSYSQDMGNQPNQKRKILGLTLPF